MLFAPQRVQPAPNSWRVLWEKALAGQVAINAAPDPIGIAFTVIADALFGGRDYLKSFDAGITAISTLAPRVASWSPFPDVYTAIINGSVALGVGWNGRGRLRAAELEGRLAVAIPVEGTVTQNIILGLVKGSRDAEAARSFVSYALGAEAQQAVAERLSYAPVNTSVRLSPAALARVGASPEQKERASELDWPALDKLRDAITEQWRRRIITHR